MYPCYINYYSKSTVAQEGYHSHFFFSLDARFYFITLDSWIKLEVWKNYEWVKFSNMNVRQIINYTNKEITCM